MHGKLLTRRTGWMLSLLPGILRKMLPIWKLPQTKISLLRPRWSSNWRRRFLWHILPSNKPDHRQDHTHPLNHIRFIDQSGRLHHSFVHATIDSNQDWDCLSREEKSLSGVYIKTPRDFMQPRNLLKLIRYLYGLKKIPCNLFQQIKYKLEGACF